MQMQKQKQKQTQKPKQMQMQKQQPEQEQQGGLPGVAEGAAGFSTVPFGSAFKGLPLLAAEPPSAGLAAFAVLGPLEGGVPFSLAAALVAAEATAFIIAPALLPVAAFAVAGAALDAGPGGFGVAAFCGTGASCIAQELQLGQCMHHWSE